MRRLLFTLFIALSLAAVAGAQTFRGAINGAVTDPTGAVVPGATVKATEKATGVVHTTITTSEGQFAFQDLPLGSYVVNVSASGFSTITVDSVAVNAGSIYTLPVKLKIGQESTSVEVSAAAIALDTTTQTRATERTRLHATSCGGPGLRRLFRRWLWLSQWYACQSDELADRRY